MYIGNYGCICADRYACRYEVDRYGYRCTYRYDVDVYR